MTGDRIRHLPLYTRALCLRKINNKNKKELTWPALNLPGGTAHPCQWLPCLTWNPKSCKDSAEFRNGNLSIPPILHSWQILHIISKHTQLRIHWPWSHSCPKSCHKNLLALILSCWPFTGQKKYTERVLRNCGVVSAEKWNTKHLVHHEGLALETSASPLPHVVQCSLSTHWIKPKFL